MAGPLVPTPAPLPLTYADAVCGIDVDSLGRETGSDLENLVQDVFHLLLEDLGSNPDDEQRGVGIVSMLRGDAVSVTRAAAAIDRQLGDDDRVTSSKTTITAQDDAGTYLIAIRIQAGDQVIGANFSYAAGQGLTFLGNTGVAT